MTKTKTFSQDAVAAVTAITDKFDVSPKEARHVLGVFFF